MAERNLYLSNTPVEEALAKFMQALEAGEERRRQKISASETLDRVTAQAVYARYNSPLFNAAAMDGIAVIAANTAGACETNPVRLVKTKDFMQVDTGGPIKPPYDAVIMAEDIQQLDEDTALIREAAASGQHIRPIGEDIVAGEMLLPCGHLVRPVDIGVLLAAGITQIEVFQKPKVAIFPTGNEIIEPGETPKEGQIIDSNTRMLEALVHQNGGEAARFPSVPDDPTLLEDALKTALTQFDMALVNAGSSAGTQDYTAAVLQKLGKVLVHGVAMKPGKPVVLAIAEGKPVIGIPGYPVSAYLAYRTFAAPVLAMLAGRKLPAPEMVEAVVAKRIVSSLKHREYVRVTLGKVDGKLVASPLARGAGAAMSLVRADGFCVIAQNSEGIDAGQSAQVQLLRPLHELENNFKEEP